MRDEPFDSSRESAESPPRLAVGLDLKRFDIDPCRRAPPHPMCEVKQT